MRNFDFRRYLCKCLCLLFLSVFFGTVNAQELYVGDGGSFYLPSSIDFTTSNNIIRKTVNGVFSVEGGTNWAVSSEYVDGSVLVLGAGTTVANIGDVEQSTVTITTSAGDQILCNYSRNQPTGNLDASLSNYVLSDTEFWTITKNAGSSTDVMVSGLTEATSATYGGNNSQSPILVRFDGTNWVSYTTSPGFGNFAFASLNTDGTLSVDSIDSITNFSLYPNPIETNTKYVYLNWAGESELLDMNIYDARGRKISEDLNILILSGQNSLDIPKLESGIYFFKFSFQKTNNQITKQIIIK